MSDGAPPILPAVLAFTTRERTRDLLRRAFTRRKARLQLARSAAGAAAALRASLVDAVIVDLTAAGDDAWRVASMARELPSIPFFAIVAPRLSDAAVLGRCAALDVADLLVDGVDNGALRELVTPSGFTARFADALRDLHVDLGLDAPLQRQAWEFAVSHGGRPVRTDAIAQAAGVTREHLSRAFSASGAPNLKRVIDLVRLLAAAELAKNPGYDLADVATVLDFASPSHLASTAQRVAGIRAASLTRLRTGDLVNRFHQGRTRSRV
ncbi:MAG: helix-turn-helix domain-containing protein [Gemmatimonadetes bacterium]|nr:helix-turn-helix domain-containing protein [Gemmatimonadota bacterium]